MSFLQPQVKGSIPVGALVGGAAQVVSLPVGADGTVLTADSTTPSGLKYAAGGGGGSAILAGARVFSSINISIPNATPTFISFDTELYDDGAFFNPINPTRLTIPETGIYNIFGIASFATSGAGMARSVFARLNGAGTNWLFHGALTVFSGTQPTYVNAAVSMKFTAGDYIEMGVYQDSGGALNLTQLEGFGIAFGIAGR